MRKSTIADAQYAPSAADLQVLLALTRGRTLADASARLHADASTVFRTLQRIEKQLGQRLFERTRGGYLPTDTMLALAPHAERIESELEAARAAAVGGSEAVSGRVRLTTVDAVLRGLVLPALPALARKHPQLQLELRASNELMSLTKRDADLALRAIVPTSKPPEHLIGRRLGAIPFALCAPKAWPLRERRRAPDRQPWIGPDEGLPEHPTVRWRRRHFPRVVPQFLVENVVGVVDAIQAGLGVGLVPHFLLKTEPGLALLDGPLEDCESSLWLLAHPESRHLRRIAAVYQHFAEHIVLPA